ncbi:hypothetical protein L226DRAFT_40684 [Lentinus tigrinus ALCF2SS1-7]|uniref:uncharacterized protein n=1 Tax=Lentinus tigrinus ALCF2SS1-7 TaxID=1328758 RepID=UPI001165D8C1|nr:hypothetical protein L226DRAFT_40684 [Lentinus tigrinus ALCF2SS1-7]
MPIWILDSGEANPTTPLPLPAFPSSPIPRPFWCSVHTFIRGTEFGVSGTHTHSTHTRPPSTVPYHFISFQAAAPAAQARRVSFALLRQPALRRSGRSGVQAGASRPDLMHDMMVHMSYVDSHTHHLLYEPQPAAARRLTQPISRKSFPPPTHTHAPCPPDPHSTHTCPGQLRLGHALESVVCPSV